MPSIYESMGGRLIKKRLVSEVTGPPGPQGEQGPQGLLGDSLANTVQFLSGGYLWQGKSGGFSDDSEGFFFGTDDDEIAKLKIGNNKSYLKYDPTAGAGRTLMVKGTIWADVHSGAAVKNCSYATRNVSFTSTSGVVDGQTTVPLLYDGVEFNSNGSGVFVDSKNDYDRINWSGSTETSGYTSLTGATSVQSHSNYSALVYGSTVLVDANSNTIRIYQYMGGTGNNALEEVVRLGVRNVVDSNGNTTTDNAGPTAQFGVAGSWNNHTGVLGISYSSYGMHGTSTTSSGVYGASTSGYGVYGTSTSGVGGYFEGNSTGGAIQLKAQDDTPTSAASGSMANVNNQLVFADGTSWKKVCVPTVSPFEPSGGSDGDIWLQFFTDGTAVRTWVNISGTWV